MTPKNLRRSLRRAIGSLTAGQAPAARTRGARGSAPHDSLTPFEKSVLDQVKPFTMTSPERVVCLVDAVNYIVGNDIPGDFVECGVWQGGSVMAMAYTLLERGVTDRRIHLYDTFQGMSAPTDDDEDLKGRKAADRLATEPKESSWGWAYAPIDIVRRNVTSTGYPEERFTFVEGKAEDTVPLSPPDRIALLRLDTDWYESTKVELEHLFPRLVRGGILIIDDYGHWKGCRKAVDEYFAAHRTPIFLSRIDYTGRVGVKLAE